MGKFADLVILSDNPLTVPENNLADIEVPMTMVGGVVEYTAPGEILLSAEYMETNSQTMEKSNQPVKMETLDRTRFASQFLQ